uniref:Uncharacterized protein n=1 Tax=Salmo trutta TaxID=8032 RepID=A0A674E5S4_SALTR
MRMPEKVDQEPRGPHTDNYMGFLDFMWVGESLDGLQYYGETESCEEHSVDQSPHHLSPDPSEGVFICRLCFLSKAHGHQSHKQLRKTGPSHIHRIHFGGSALHADFSKATIETSFNLSNMKRKYKDKRRHHVGDTDNYNPLDTQ